MGPGEQFEFSFETTATLPDTPPPELPKDATLPDAPARPKSSAKPSKSPDRGPARPDVYREVTERILEALEKGVKPWESPWDAAAAGFASPRNPVTNKRYRGINVLLLLCNDHAGGGDPRWMTFKQAQSRGWRVRKGERSTRIYFYKALAKDSEAEDSASEEKEKRREKSGPYCVLRAYSVFHASQIEGIPPFERPNKGEEFDPLPLAEELMNNSGAEIRYGGRRAFYSPSTDHVQLPPRESFRHAAGFYSVALHELSHWSGGSEQRVPRNMPRRRGSDAYAREELRAEMASAFLTLELGIPHDLGQHASYIASWIQVLKEDKHEIVRAASNAQRIADYLLTFLPEGSLPDAQAPDR